MTEMSDMLRVNRLASNDSDRESCASMLGSSPISPLDALLPSCHLTMKGVAPATDATHPAKPIMASLPVMAHANTAGLSSSTLPPPPPPPPVATPHHMLTVSLQTLVGCSELLGHSLDNREAISGAQVGKEGP